MMRRPDSNFCGTALLVLWGDCNTLPSGPSSWRSVSIWKTSLASNLILTKPNLDQTPHARLRLVSAVPPVRGECHRIAECLTSSHCPDAAFCFRRSCRSRCCRRSVSRVLLAFGYFVSRGRTSRCWCSSSDMTYIWCVIIYSSERNSASPAHLSGNVWEN